MATETQTAPPRGEPLSEHDRELLDGLDRALQDGRELYEWWRKIDARDGYSNRFPLDRELRRPDTNYGFLEEVPLRHGLLPVLGVIQDMLFDRPKSPLLERSAEAEWMRAQVQEYMMRYFMRVSSSRQPEAESGKPKSGLRSFLEDLGVQDGKKAKRVGWGYSQLFYKLAESGEVRAFPKDRQRAIIDLRQIGTTYEWIVLKVNIFEFDVAVHLAGTDGPQIEIPVPEVVYTVLTRDFMVDEEKPREGVLGEYGYGYAFIPDPTVKSILAYGPTGLTSAFETIHFRVLESGEVRAKMAFVANQPVRLLGVDPVDWSIDLADRLSLGTASFFLSPLKKALDNLLPQPDPVFATLDLANAATGGQLAYQLGISKERLIKNIMALHFFDAYNFFLETVTNWKLVPDWLDEKNLPEWARKGTWS